MKGLAVLCLVHAAWCGQAAVAPRAEEPRVAGVDAGSGIAYALVSTEGVRTGDAGRTWAPRLTAMCKKLPDGRYRFELWADEPGFAGERPQLAFFPPWKQTQYELFPPSLVKVSVTLEFLGYTKVKPVKRQWEYLHELAGELRYSTPGGSSSNMEEVMFYLQYLKSLPTLRLTVPGRGSEEFETTRWQAAVKAEPLCHASGY